MIRVVAWLWRDEGYRFNRLFRYGPRHVNILAAAVRRNLTLDHEFVCITDDPEGLNPAIRVVRLWDDWRGLGGCYTRLRAFAPDMAEIIGPRFVWMDIDCVVTGNLDPLFDRPEDFVIWSNGVSNNPYCGSMVMMTAGARQRVWRDFDPATSPMRAKRYVGTDQAWIASKLGRGEAVWTRRDGVLSRYHTGLMDSKLLGRAGRIGRKELPAGARVVFFHGPVDPSQPTLQEHFPWIREHWKE